MKFNLPLVAALAATSFFLSLGSPAVGASSTSAGSADSVRPYSAGRPHGGGSVDPHATLPEDKHVEVAIQHWEEGRPQEALNSLDRAIEYFPYSARLLSVRASLRQETGQLAAALADMEAAVRADPADPLLLVNRSQLYRRFQRGNDAMADLDKAITMDPDLLAARFNRGSLLASVGKLDQALIDFDRCIALDPHLAAPYFNRASVHYMSGQVELAIADLNRFLELNESVEWGDAARDLIKQWSSGEGSEDSSAANAKDS